MNKRREVSNVNYFGSLVILAGMLISLVLPAQTIILAEKTANVPKPVSENTNELKKTDYGKCRFFLKKTKDKPAKKQNSFRAAAATRFI
jgi:hypothetical protein